MKHVFDTPISPSHIDGAYRLSLAIISNCPFLEQAFFAFPDPDFPLYWPSGERASIHRKGLQVVDIQGCRIGNTHFHPLGLWGRSYFEDAAQRFTQGIGELLERQAKRPLVLAGDFNLDDPSLLRPSLFADLELRDGLPEGQRTAPGSKRRPDHIFYSPELTCVDRKVVETNTDHFLCCCEFRVGPLGN
jgi:endonuclease/exonuclease/phosphatase family metal-dependent hydrolase